MSGSYKYDDTLEGTLKAASNLTLQVVYPPSNILMVDIDNADARLHFEKQLAMLQEGEVGLVLDTFFTTSKSGCGWHFYIKISRNLKPMTRIGLQSVLGSDPKREALSIRKVMLGHPHPTVLFEAQEEYDKVQKWLNPPCKKVDYLASGKLSKFEGSSNSPVQIQVVDLTYK